MEHTTDSKTPPAPRPEPRRRWRVFRWLLILFAILLVWLNGPGTRLLAPKLATHFLAKIGISLDVRIQGTLTGGLSLHDLSLSNSTTLQSLTIQRITPDYRLRDLTKGKLRGIEIAGIAAHIDLATPPEDPPESEPPDLTAILKTLRSAHTQALPIAVKISDLNLKITREGQPFYQLGSTTFTHLAGSTTYQLDLGTITGPANHQLPAQSSNLTWTADAISLDRIEPWPGISLQDLNLQTPEFSGPALSAVLQLRDAVFDLESSTNFAATSLRLREGALDLAETAASFGAELPASATLTSFALEADNLFPDPLAAIGELQIVLENVAWQDWNTPEIILGTTLTTDSATLALRTRLGEAPLALDATTTLDRNEGAFSPGTVTGTFSAENLPALVRHLAGRFPQINPSAEVPPASLTGEFETSLTDFKPTAASASASLTPLDPTTATPLDLAARWAPDADLAATIVIDGLKLDVTYNPDAKSYSATLAANEFRSPRIAPWLAIANVTLPGELRLAADWTGTGNLSENQHRGDLDLATAEWLQPDRSPITVTGSLSHDWPKSVQAHTLLVQAEKQNIRLKARMANQTLELDDLLWRDGETEIASGSATLPIPEDFSKWREMIATDERPLTLAIETRELSFSLLDPWLPTAARLSPESRAKLNIQASGSFADPTLTASLACTNLRSPASPDLPPADLLLNLNATDGSILLTGTATAHDFPPAQLKATLPFRPATWAETPDALLAEPLTATIDLPALDLARFTSLVPALSRLAGTLSGKLTASGTPKNPEVTGQLNLTNAAATFKNPAIPPVTALNATVDASLAAITLRSLTATLAGGSLNGSGTLNLDAGKPTTLDFRLRGSQLPVRRDESVIIRANADFRLAGTLDQATLSGTIGIVDSLFYRDIELLPIGTPFNAPSAAALPRIDATPTLAKAAIPAPFGAWILNLTVRTDAPLLIRGNLADGQVTAALKITGTFNDPRPTGTVKIEDFRAALPFSSLSVRSATLVFTPQNGWDPAIEARGQSDPRPYRVNAYVYGRLSDPQLVLTSNPPLPENEIMTLLATGTTTSQLENPQAASSRAIQLLAEEIRRGRVRFGRQLRPILAVLDNVDFSLAETDPYASDAYSTATVAITDRWFVSAGMGEEGNNRAFVIWRIALR